MLCIMLLKKAIRTLLRIRFWICFTLLMTGSLMIFNRTSVYRKEWLKEHFKFFHETDEEIFKKFVNTSGDATVRPDICDNCNLQTFSYIFNNDAICKVVPGQPEVVLFIFLLTSVQRRDHRDALRQTWLRYAARNVGKVRYAFLLGRFSKDEIQERYWRRLVGIENAQHNDMLQADFLDTYRNLTRKVLMGYNYASKECSNAKFVLKTDDDMWINIPTLLRVLEKKTEPLQSALGGHCHRGYMSPVRENVKHKWYISYQEYPHDVYPHYCSGLGYVTSMTVVHDIVQVYPNVPYFPMEDVYVGLCIEQLGFSVLALPGFKYIYSQPPDPCSLHGTEYITRHGISPEDKIAFWNASCPFDFQKELLRQM